MPPKTILTPGMKSAPKRSTASETATARLCTSGGYMVNQPSIAIGDVGVPRATTLTSRSYKRCGTSVSLTQELLAEKADLGYHDVVRIENKGRASLEQLTAMAEVFAALGESVTAESLKLEGG